MLQAAHATLRCFSPVPASGLMLQCFLVTVMSGWKKKNERRWSPLTIGKGLVAEQEHQGKEAFPKLPFILVFLEKRISVCSSVRNT